MSYYAWGNGEAKLKEGTDTEKLREKLSELDALDFNLAGETIEFFGCDNYYEAEVIKFLETLSPHVVEGKITYSGDEDLHWRFVFNSKTGKWDEENGVVDYNMESYSEKEIIKKAISLGYIMYKPIDIKGRYTSKIRSVESLNEEAPDGCVHDTDTILKDLLDTNDFEFSGVEFSEYLSECSKKITKNKSLLERNGSYGI